MSNEIKDEKKPLPPTRASGPAIASLILGLFSVICCPVMLISLICAVAGLICGIYAVKKCKPSTKTDIAGIITSSLGLLIFTVIICSAAYIFGSVDNYSQLSPHTLDIVGNIDDVVTDYDRDGTLPDYLEEHREAWEDIWSRCGDSLVQSYGKSDDDASTSEEETVTTE